MLYFFWGVFRRKKESSLQQGPVSPKKFCVPPDIPDAIMALPENVCSLGSTKKILPMPDRSNFVVAPAPGLVDLPSFSSVKSKNMEQQDCKPYPKSSTFAQIKLDESGPMMLVDINSDRELQVSLEAPSATCGSNTPMSEKVAADAPETSETKLWDGVKNPLADATKKQKTGPYEWNNPTRASIVRDSRMGEEDKLPSVELAALRGSRISKIDINLDAEAPEEEEALEVKTTSRVGMLDINLDEEPPEEEAEAKTSTRVGILDINLDEEPPEEEEDGKNPEW